MSHIFQVRCELYADLEAHDIAIFLIDSISGPTSSFGIQANRLHPITSIPIKKLTLSRVFYVFDPTSDWY